MWAALRVGDRLGEGWWVIFAFVVVWIMEEPGAKAWKRAALA